MGRSGLRQSFYFVDKNLTSDKFILNLSSRQDAQISDEGIRVYVRKCQVPTDPCASERPDDPNYSVGVDSWDADNALLSSAKIGDKCDKELTDEYNSCNIVMFQGKKAKEQYWVSDYQGEGSNKIYTFFNGSLRYILRLRYSDDYVKLDAAKEMERNNKYVKTLNAMANSLIFFEPTKQ
ncbi:MAG: hypothetical protein Q8L47_05435 [bacterium]|nr:hypothetical protein [bacterium]